ncbi:MAG: pyrimidine/purine nucleoside phosphorylase [Candidatus Omnitrophota bacterium]|nr:pyrimidine/purine nucleoside phosphorylase [Candidatus Omnitrophota bacterium]
MVEVNEYFDGNVKSLVVNSNKGKRTVGVMMPGEYEFNTTTKETMTVVSGELSVYFAEEGEWEEFGEGASFDVPANSKFKAKVMQDTAYLCEYEQK